MPFFQCCSVSETLILVETFRHAFFRGGFFTSCFPVFCYNVHMERKRQKIQREARWRRVRFFVRVHAWVTGSVLLAYALLGFLWGPSFSISNFRERWSSFADDVTVSAVVPPPPSAPVVVAEAICPAGTLFVSLDWGDDSGATTFDVYRDSALLVSGLVDSEYDDTSVAVSTSYSYVVVAYGPMDPGVASSVAVSVTTPSGCLELLTPTLDIVTVADTNVMGLGSVSVSDTTPVITGTSNMPTASVSIAIVGATSTYALLSTNVNGYWEWTPVSALPLGTYTLTVTVTHPLFPLQTASDTLSLTILSMEAAGDDNDDDDGGGSKKKKKRPVASASTPTYRTPPELPLPESPEPPRLIEGLPSAPFLTPILDVENTGNWVFQGRTLQTTLSIEAIRGDIEGRSGDIIYIVRDPENDEVYTASRSGIFRKGVVFAEEVPVSRTWRSGEYHISATLRAGGMSVVAEVPFRVVELPLFNLGGGMLVTWNDATRFLGWASLWSLLFSLLLLLLFAREYWLYLHSRKHITERDFPGHGLLRSEKGKEVDHV